MVSQGSYAAAVIKKTYQMRSATATTKMICLHNCTVLSVYNFLLICLIAVPCLNHGKKCGTLTPTFIACSRPGFVYVGPLKLAF